ncbi:MAG TPA: ATP-binding protein [Actinomycetota bacterium]|nr:ATP-binding protein [Actinomycetota bacterium]
MTDWIRRLPLGVRIAVLTSTTLVILLILVGLLVQRQFRDVLRDDIDRVLLDRARMATKAPRDVDGPELLDHLLARYADLDTSDTSDVEIQVMSENGSVIAATPGLAGIDALVRGGSRVRVASGVPVFGDVTIDGSVHRFVGLSSDNATDDIVVTAVPIQEMSDTESALLEVYVPLALVAAAVAALAGGFIARRSLAPLRHFATEADALGRLDLSQRLSIPPSADEIGRLGATLNRMLGRLDAALRRERELTAEVGHELRTPLAIIRAEVELLDQQITDEKVKASLDSILEEVDRTTGVIDDMLLLARVDANATLDRSQVVDLGQLTRTVVERFSAIAATRGVSLETRGKGQLEGDARAIDRAIVNLVDNALRHTPAGGAVEIALDQGEKGPILTVRDTGPGVPAETLGTMFDRFTRGGPRRGAAGLGLAIVAAMARSHEGDVQARNRPEGGLEITIEFPAPSTDAERGSGPQ